MLSADTTAAVREKLNGFGEPGAVPLTLAQELIRASAWWHGHPQSLVRAPKHAEHVANGPLGLELTFGANYFLVERAIILSKRAIIEALKQAIASNSTVDGNALRARLSTCIRKSVANYNHEVYDYYQGGVSPEERRRRPFRTLGGIGVHVEEMRPSVDASKGFMHFGVQAIKVGDFVDAIWKLADLKTVCT